MNRYEWLAFGIANGFCTQDVCSTHDGVPNTPEEEAQFEDGYDPCVHVVRLLHAEEKIDPV